MTALLNQRAVTLGTVGRGHYPLSGLSKRQRICSEKGLTQVGMKKQGSDKVLLPLSFKLLPHTTIQAHLQYWYLQIRLLTSERLTVIFCHTH